MSLNIAFLESEIQDQYLYDESPRPWIIGFSGGKDSTMLLQMVWYAIKKLPQELRTRDIHVVCNDTLVENPKIAEFIEETLYNIQEAAIEQAMPIQVKKTSPRLEDTFWVNLIGRGYPAPTSTFRWCTERMKINPTTKYILETISEKGEAIILLGTRSDESASRARSMKKHERGTNRLRKHPLPNAYVYAPIKDVLIDELWQYLLQVPSPWNGTNRKLITLYKNATGGDCPLVIDTTTPSCGQSRFGCWVCTVVKRDKSMDALIDNGEDWMEPLQEIRDKLLEYRKPEYREVTRRNKTEGPGPMKPEYRYDILKDLLESQKAIQEHDPSMVLIGNQELVAIQVIWYRDNIFRHSVSDLYNSVYKKRINMGKINSNLQKEWKNRECGKHK
jgi:DNA sulfur modification protein DndC